MWYRFEVQELGGHAGRLYFVRADGRRQMLSGLPAEACERLRRSFFSHRELRLDDWAPAHRLALEQAGVVRPLGDAPKGHWVGRPRRLSAGRLLALLARQADVLASLPALAAIAGFVAWAWLWALEPAAFGRPGLLGLALEGAELQALAVAGAVFLASVLVHECGHALAASRHAGGFGRLRLRWLLGLPAMTVDVSAQCCAGAWGKAAIWLAGSVFQAGFAAALLVLVDAPAVRLGALASSVVALWCLLPLPGNDGQQLIAELARVRMRPRLFGRDATPLERGYGALLLALLGASLPLAWSLALELVRRAQGLSAAASATHWVVAAWLAVVVVFYLSTATQLLRLLLARGPDPAPASMNLNPRT